MQALKTQLLKLTGLGQYQKASSLAKQALLEIIPFNGFSNPLVLRKTKSAWLAYQYAKLLGDWADDLPATKQRRLKKESIQILKAVMKAEARGERQLDAAASYACELNLYYQSQDFKNMLQFGRRLVRQNHKKGHYTVAVATTHLLDSTTQRRATALRGVQSWKLHLAKGREPYYFAYYCLAQCELFAGNPKHAMRALTRAGQLSKRPIDCTEFNALYKKIQSAVAAATKPSKNNASRKK